MQVYHNSFHFQRGERTRSFHEDSLDTPDSKKDVPEPKPRPFLKSKRAAVVVAPSLPPRTNNKKVHRSCCRS